MLTKELLDGFCGYSVYDRACDAIRTDVEPPKPCGGTGSIQWAFDGWDPCRVVDCIVCGSRNDPARRALATAMHGMGRAIRRMAVGSALDTAERLLGGFRALALIGNAVSQADIVLRRIGWAFATAGEVWQVPAKGAYYRISVKRGKSKASDGVTGVCTWIGEQHYGGRYINSGRMAGSTMGGRTVTRLGIKDADGAMHWVSESQVTRIGAKDAPTSLVEADNARKAMKARETARNAVAPEFIGATGKRGDMVCIVDGPNAGKSGRAFWQGMNRSGKTVGVKAIDERGNETGDPMWCDVRHVIGKASTYVNTTTNRIDDYVPEHYALAMQALIEACEINMSRLMEHGFMDQAEEWARQSKAITV